MKHISAYLYIIAVSLLASACGGHAGTAADRTMYVTIAPLAEIIEGITGDDFTVEVLVPAGASPETFEPTPKQFMALNESKAVFAVGLIDFETALTSRIADASKVVDLSRGIAAETGCCSHHAHGAHHAHGVDPHVWTSPRQLRTMARNAYEAIHAMYPDSAKYTSAFEALAERLDALDAECAAACAASGRRCFVIFHPALTYFARDYGIEQIAIEHEGKEPTARRLGQIIEKARQAGVRHVLYQSQFPKSAVEVVANDIGAECTPFDPLAADLTENIRRITALIVE